MSIVLSKETFVNSDFPSSETNVQLSGIDFNLIISVNHLLLETV